MSFSIPPLVVDIDDTIIQSDYNPNLNEYTNPRAISDQVDALRILKKQGHRIILHTGRHWNHYEVTIKQLREIEIPFDQLVMGKPLGIYVDADAVTDLKDLL